MGKYYYLGVCSKERIEEIGRGHAGRWRGVDARGVQKQVQRRKGTTIGDKKNHTGFGTPMEIVSWLCKSQKARGLESIGPFRSEGS